jgi:hypothetical protein
MRWNLFRFFLLIFGISQLTDCSAAEIHGIDLFGSEHLTVEEMIASEPQLFTKFCEELRAENEEKVERIQQELSEKLKTRFDLSFARLSAITYFEKQEKIVYITFDVVEHKDASKRLNFLDSPREVLDDPENLIAAWDLYMNTGMQLVAAGELDNQVVKCSAFHSLFGHQHPKLAPFEKQFVEGAARNKEELIAIFLKDGREHYRANAAFLLAYIPNGEELVEILSKRLRDPSAEVRNNVMRVFACIAFEHPEIGLPIDEVLKALDFPNTTDRNKAAAIIFGILSHEPLFDLYSNKVLAASKALLKMLKLKQPNNSEWAYQILKRISHEDFPKENLADWEQWVLSVQEKIL